MSSLTKILLTIKLEGGCIIRDTVEEFIPFKVTKQDLTNKKLPKDIGSIVVRSGKISHKNLVAKPANLKINLNIDSYNYFISNFSCPVRFPLKKWKKLTEKEKLEYHLNTLCLHHKGVEYSYVILEA